MENIAWSRKVTISVTTFHSLNRQTRLGSWILVPAISNHGELYSLHFSTFPFAQQFRELLLACVSHTSITYHRDIALLSQVEGTAMRYGSPVAFPTESLPICSQHNYQERLAIPLSFLCPFLVSLPLFAKVHFASSYECSIVQVDVVETQQTYMLSIAWEQKHQIAFQR